MTKEELSKFADRLAKLAADHTAALAQLLDEAKLADIEPAALRRLVAWSRKDEVARLEQQAVDEQYRHIVGLRANPAALPSGGRLAAAAALYGEGLTVRDVARKLASASARPTPSRGRWPRPMFNRR